MSSFVKATPETIAARQRNTLQAFASAAIRQDPVVKEELFKGASLTNAVKKAAEALATTQSRGISSSKLLRQRLHKARTLDK
ncbi:hypothetical protein [Kalamiella sp. sgz302252]|uniref:hypothetical protein n=1 Tax=Pantoea sp. sgz302252 TaxID=3341827 RepID=UPI0036D3A978